MTAGAKISSTCRSTKSRIAAFLHFNRSREIQRSHDERFIAAMNNNNRHSGADNQGARD